MIKKLSTKKDELKKQKRNQWIIGGILIFVMVFSGFGMAVNSFGGDKDQEKVTYNGFEFYKQSSSWILPLENFNLIFSHNPEETEGITNINLTKLITDYQGQPLYIDSDYELASYEIYQNIGNFVERIQPACFEELNCQKDLPIKTCENNFIIIRKAEINSITEEENCIFIEGDEENLLKLTDEFLYSIFGIK
jgi:hypothetical protein